MRPVKQAVLVAALALVACEVALRLALLSPGFVRLMMNGAPAARRLAIFETVIHERDSAVLGVPLQHDATVGWTVRPSVTLKPTRMTVDAHGLRSVAPVDPTLPFAGQRVAIVGDSFAFGADVDDDQTMAAVLGARSTDRQVLNYGVVGYGNDQMWLRTRRDVLPARPDVVVMVLVGCDLYRNQHPFTVWFKPQFALRDGQLDLVSTPPETQEAGISQYRWTPRLVDAWHVAREAYENAKHGVATITGNTVEATDLTAAIVSAWAAEVRAADATPVLLFALTPDSDMVSRDDGPLGVAEVYRRACADEGLVCVDARSPLVAAHAAGTPMRSPFGAHWSAEANALLAEALAPALDDLRRAGTPSALP